MKCPKCGFENAEGVRFCSSCGSALDRPDVFPSTETKIISSSTTTHGSANVKLLFGIFTGFWGVSTLILFITMGYMDGYYGSIFIWLFILHFLFQFIPLGVVWLSLLLRMIGKKDISFISSILK